MDPEPVLDPLALLASPGPNGPALLSVLHSLGPEEIPGLVECLVHHRVDGLAWRALGGLPGAETDTWLRATLRRACEAPNFFSTFLKKNLVKN